MNRMYHICAVLIVAAVMSSRGGNANKESLSYDYREYETSGYNSEGSSLDELHLKKSRCLVEYH